MKASPNYLLRLRWLARRFRPRWPALRFRGQRLPRRHFHRRRLLRIRQRQVRRPCSPSLEHAPDHNERTTNVHAFERLRILRAYTAERCRVHG